VEKLGTPSRSGHFNQRQTPRSPMLLDSDRECNYGPSLPQPVWMFITAMKKITMAESKSK